MRKKRLYLEGIKDYPHLAIASFDAAQDMKGKWQTFFQEEQPLIVDYGMGRGSYVINLSQADSSLNFLGVECAIDRITQACIKLEKTDSHNVRFSNMLTAQLTDIFAEGEVDRVIVNCPEPSEKKREQKRRLLGERNIASVAAVLKEGGELWLKTDHEGYYDDCYPFIAEYFDIYFEDRDFRNPDREGSIYEDPITEYEERWLEEERKFYVLRATKKNAHH